MEIGGLPMSPMMVSLGGCGSDLVGFFFFFFLLYFCFLLRWDFGGHGGVVGMVVVVVW